MNSERMGNTSHLAGHLRLLPGGSDGGVRLQCRRPGFNPCVGKISWRREWLPTPVFLPWTEEPGVLQSMGSQRVGHN